MPLGRTDFAATASSRALYVSGGNHLWTMLDSMDVRDLVTGSWTQLQMSTPRKHHAVVSTGDEVFFAGGLPWFNTQASALDSVDIYNEVTQTWTLERLPYAAAFLSGAAFGDKVYFAGGGDPVFRNIIQVFDTSTRVWSVVTVPGVGRGRQKVAMNERWLCFGADGGYSRLIDILDAETSTWRQVVAPDQMESMSIVGDRLLMTSCHPGASEQALYQYDLVADSWGMVRRPGDRCVTVNASMGPFTIFANGFWLGENRRDADIYNSLTGEWTRSTLSAAARGRVAVVDPTGGRVFVIGGHLGHNQQYLTRNIDVFHSFAAVGLESCMQVPNSSGLDAHLHASGLPSSEDNWFFLGVENGPPGAAALFLASRAQGPAVALPGSLGQLCLAAPVIRLPGPVRVVDGSGRVGVQVPLTPESTAALPISAGETWHFQCWYRDSNPGPTSNLTSLRSVTFD